MKFILVSLVFLLVSCCKKDESIDINSPCIQMEQNPTFKTEPFKEGYTIQFPHSYDGDGLKIEEFVSFKKTSKSNINFSYEYLSTTDMHKYYDIILANPIPSKLQSPSQSLSENLPFKKEFCIDEKIVAILYYSKNVNSLSEGKLYMAYKDWYYEGLNIEFQNESQLEEIFSIIKTIQKE